MFYLYHINTFTYYDLKTDFVIGRTSGELVIPDGRLSGQHARISLEDSSYYIEDLESKNRTILNRTEIIPHEKVKLLKDSFLELGNQSFIITESKNLTVEEVNLIIDKNQSKQVMKAEGVKLVREMKEKLQQEIQKSTDLQNEVSEEIENNAKLIAEQQALILHYYEARDKELQRLEKEKEMVLHTTEAQVGSVKLLITVYESAIEELKKKNAELAEEHEKKVKRAKAVERSPGIEPSKPQS